MIGSLHPRPRVQEADSIIDIVVLLERVVILQLWQPVGSYTPREDDLNYIWSHSYRQQALTDRACLRVTEDTVDNGCERLVPQQQDAQHPQTTGLQVKRSSGVSCCIAGQLQLL